MMKPILFIKSRFVNFLTMLMSLLIGAGIVFSSPIQYQFALQTKALASDDLNSVQQHAPQNQIPQLNEKLEKIQDRLGKDVRTLESGTGEINVKLSIELVEIILAISTLGFASAAKNNHTQGINKGSELVSHIKDLDSANNEYLTALRKQHEAELKKNVNPSKNALVRLWNRTIDRLFERKSQELHDFQDNVKRLESLRDSAAVAKRNFETRASTMGSLAKGSALLLIGSIAVDLYLKSNDGNIEVSQMSPRYQDQLKDKMNGAIHYLEQFKTNQLNKFNVVKNKFLEKHQPKEPKSEVSTPPSNANESPENGNFENEDPAGLMNSLDDQQ